MTPEFLAEVAKHLYVTAFLLAGPVMGVGLVVGLVVSLFQAVTQINEMTLAFIPKIGAIALTLLVTTPYLLKVLTSYTLEILHRFPEIGG